jgi:hypothetical protein
MNATLNTLRQLKQSAHLGLRKQATPTASGSTHQRNDVPGSYGRGSYAGHSTYTLDFRTQGSYGRGIYAGRSTAGLDLGSQGSYGRGIYAGRSTADLDFGAQRSFADGV